MNLRLKLAGALLLAAVALSGCAYYGSYRYGYSDDDGHYYREYPYGEYHSYYYSGRPHHYYRERDAK